MTEVTLYPGDVFTDAHGGVDIPPVGTPPQWNDGLDSTYAIARLDSVADVAPLAYLGAQDLVGTPSSLVYHVRASTVAANPAPIQVGLISDDLSVFMLGHGEMLEEQAPATPTWLVSPAIPIAFPVEFAVAASAGTIKLLVAQTLTTSSTDTQTMVYEAYVVVTCAASVAPPCHLYPRDDNLGVGSGAIWPPPSSGRPGSYY